MQEAFLDHNSVGHETAASQVKHMKESLCTDGQTLASVPQIRRGNSNVMKSLFSNLKV